LRHFYTDQDSNRVEKGVKQQSKNYVKQKKRLGKVHLFA